MQGGELVLLARSFDWRESECSSVDRFVLKLCGLDGRGFLPRGFICVVRVVDLMVR